MTYYNNPFYMDIGQIGFLSEKSREILPAPKILEQYSSCQIGIIKKAYSSGNVRIQHLKNNDRTLEKIGWGPNTAFLLHSNVYENSYAFLYSIQNNKNSCRQRLFVTSSKNNFVPMYGENFTKFNNQLMKSLGICFIEKVFPYHRAKFRIIPRFSSEEREFFKTNLK